MLQNIHEAQCCQDIEKCIEELQSDEVLQDVETPPSCITHHPGFRVNCLEKWWLRLSSKISPKWFRGGVSTKIIYYYKVLKYQCFSLKS